MRVDAAGNTLEVYCSGSDAARKLGFTPSQLSAALRGRTVEGTVNGHIFRYIDSNMSLGRAVELIGDDGNVLQMWPSATVAMRTTGVSNGDIGRVCNAGGGEARGLYFRYKKEEASSANSALPDFVPPPVDARDYVNRSYRDTSDGNREMKVLSMFFERGAWVFNIRPVAKTSTLTAPVLVDKVLQVAEWLDEDLARSTFTASPPLGCDDSDVYDGDSFLSSSSSSSSLSSSQASGSGRVRRTASTYGVSRRERNDAQEIRSLLKGLNLMQHAAVLVRERLTLAVMRHACDTDDYNRNWLRDNLVELGFTNAESNAVLLKVESLGYLSVPLSSRGSADSSSSSSSSSSSFSISSRSSLTSPRGVQYANDLPLAHVTSVKMLVTGSRSFSGSAPSALNDLDLSDVPPDILPVLRDLCGDSYGSSRYKGISKKGRRWSAKIKIAGEAYYLGTYETEFEAATVYARARYKLEKKKK
jgi:hypothetical protein